MKHDWEDISTYLDGERRRCKNCKAVQTLERTYWWGRVIGRDWRPLVGRCKGKLMAAAGERAV